MRRSDALSKDMELAGLPKACKTWLDVNTLSLGAASAWNNIYQETRLFNYGPFVLSGAGAPYIYGQVQVQEPGVYGYGGGYILNTAGVDTYPGFNYNGLLGSSPTHLGLGSVNVAATFGARCSIWGVAELKAGDTMQLMVLIPSAPVIVSNTWFYMEKKGGQY